MTQVTVGIVGLGAMGLGIAQVFAASGAAVRATDLSARMRDQAVAGIAASLDRRVVAGRLSEAERDATLARIAIVERPDDLASCAMVIEAIVEDLGAKAALFATLDGVLDPRAVLASNTSSLSVGALAGATAHPGRVLGLHFFNPAPAMKLVELVAHDGTDPAALALARTLTEAAGKTVIACADRPGFIVNRCARPFYGEALALLEEGRSPAEIDAAMLGAGYRMGPFALIDLVGADVNLAATRSLAGAMGGHPRYHVFDALLRQVESGNLGRKTGRGFLFPDAPGAPPADAAEIVLRIEATLANEAATLLDEGGVTEEGIDTALKLGLNFPRGAFEAARAQGLPAILARLCDLEQAAPAPLAGRYRPSDRLVALGDPARRGGRVDHR